MAIRWKAQPPLQELLPEVEQWYSSEAGHAVRLSEQALVERALDDCFGYFMLQLSVDRHCDFSQYSRIQRSVRCHPHIETKQHQAACRFDELPFATDSIDCAVLHHVQEFVANPHAVLREMQRIIVPRGQLVVVGFNPWSLLGARAMFSRLLPGPTWHNHLLPSSRVADWMELLGFTVSQVSYGYSRPLLRRFPQLPLGGVYVITAVKEVAAVNPPRKRWVPSTPQFGLAPVKPTANRHQPNSTTRREVA